MTTTVDKYGHNGNQIETAGEIRFDSIYRFKGQQAPLVIIVDADLQNIGKQHEKNRLFC
ncbi:MAG: hypothetical protein WCP79_12900 [Bacillota bacterium]